MAITQKQIAAHLGISPQAVGFALRGDGTLSEGLRRQIRLTAAEMGYQAGSNQAARFMAAQRHGIRATTGFIGCIWRTGPSSKTSYWFHLQAGMLRAAQREGQELVIFDDSPAAGWEKVDGIIGHSRPPELPTEVPFVALMQGVAGKSSLLVDEEDGIRQATEYLLSLGHRNIGFLVSEESQPAQRRVATYRATLTAAGIVPRPEWQHLLRDWGPMEESGRRGMAHWLEDGFRELGITALLVQNDRAAMGAMQTLLQAGIRIPDDISIVGFDGTDECEIVYPRLTSVKVPLESMGERAVELLLRQIKETDGAPETALYPVELQIRASTAPPRKF